ncbi:radical SAM family heme chaperone HemW [Hathewaya histolytica]|uniref:Heme chaperone HemW n=1 Tax=Hathewaya histolytica TaxID=1498 RepID=A0A4U9RFR8_HATHI|nr:radical SAM family heme chaperone HemW [Hathewaya histolytica]VTQ90705.1 oxygen-independent coproporphyrinogen III oxidase [Hathewaya histolytica]
MKEKSLYIHIPFCPKKCLYCDFSSFANIEYLMDDYVDALCKEILFYKNIYKFKTIFIGGGTPTFLNIQNLEKLGECIKELDLSKDLEFTMEGNPGTFNLQKLKAIKGIGVNRLSMGVQSYDNNLLDKIGRIHTAEEFEKNYFLCREAGFDNINLDLMFGLPSQKLEHWKTTLQKAVLLNPEHLSCYSLIIEEGTPFYKMYKDRKGLPTEEEEREMYNYTLQFLKHKGYKQYEISNFAKEGKKCKHNLAYWDLEDYLGCGTAAHSFIEGNRMENVTSIKDYIDRINSEECSIGHKHVNSNTETIEEFMFMGLRKIDGIDKNIFKNKFNIEIHDIYNKVIEKYKKLNLLYEDENKLALTKEGIEFSNTVMAEFILD